MSHTTEGTTGALRYHHDGEPDIDSDIDICSADTGECLATIPFRDMLLLVANWARSVHTRDLEERTDEAIVLGLDPFIR